MTHAPRHCDLRRSGVTLVELLIVILVMLMITAVTVPAIRPALEGRKTREAARIVEVFLNGARNRAIESGHPVGVLIEPDEFEPSQCIALSYVEQPDPYAGDFTNSKINVLGNGGFGAWMTPPQVFNTVPPSYIPGISAGDPVFPMGDIGWYETVAPGDLLTLGVDDTVQYRIFLGEPYIDVNANGKFDFGEPFNDVDGSGLATNGLPPGIGYTPPDPTYLDPITGFFVKQIPPVTWGTPTAKASYTYADPSVAINYMSPTGLALDKGTGLYDMPIYLNPKFLSQYAVPGIPPHISIDSTNTGAVVGNGAFLIIRRPIPSSSTVVNLPDSTCIDLGSNIVPPGSTNIVGVPGSGYDMLVPFSAGSSSTLGYYASFRPNPICDHETNPSFATSNLNDFNRPLMITFGPSGALWMVYSWDERHFMNDITGPPPITSAIPNFTDYQGRIPAGPIYLLIGRRELIDGDPETKDAFSNGVAPLKPVFNFQDPSSLWVSINPRTGLIATTENVPPNLTQAPPTTQTLANPQIQLYLNAQTYQARSLARAALDMGGM